MNRIDVIRLKTEDKSLKINKNYVEIKDNEDIDISRYKNTKMHVKKRIPLNF